MTRRMADYAALYVCHLLSLCIGVLLLNSRLRFLWLIED